MFVRDAWWVVLSSMFEKELTDLFAEGQVQPFWLDTTDNEKLFCWHVLPLDVYLENEQELVSAIGTGEIAKELKGTVGEKLLRRDVDSRVVVNFHGVSSLLSTFSRIPLSSLCGFDLSLVISFKLISTNNPYTLPQSISPQF